MERLKILLSGLMVIAMAISIGGPIGDTYAEEVDWEEGEFDYDRGVVIPEEMVSEIEALARTITLIISPDTVNNGDVFQAQVRYFPPITGTWKEIFIFKWPSRIDGFSEKTVRVKKAKDWSTLVSGSVESVVAPSALGIEGTFEAKVKVIKGSRILRATALMTVVNP